MNPSRRKGSAFETAVVDAYRANGYVLADRRVTNGSKDRGDISGIPSVVTEVKAEVANPDIPGALREADAEALNDGAELAIVWRKLKGKANAMDGVIEMRPAVYFKLLDVWQAHGL